MSSGALKFWNPEISQYVVAGGAGGSGGNGDGEGIPLGGTAGQVLSKASDSDLDMMWSDLSGLSTFAQLRSLTANATVTTTAAQITNWNTAQGLSMGGCTLAAGGITVPTTGVYLLSGKFLGQSPSATGVYTDLNIRIGSTIWTSCRCATAYTASMQRTASTLSIASVAAGSLINVTASTNTGTDLIWANAPWIELTAILLQW